MYGSSLGCAGAIGNYTKIKFTDDSFIEYKDRSDVDCGDSPSIFLIDPNDFENKTVEMVRLKRSDYYKDFNVDGKFNKYSLLQLIQSVY